MEPSYTRYDDFLGIGVHAYLASITQTYRERIVHEPEHYILSVDETMYVRSLAHEYRVNIPHLNFAGTLTTTDFRWVAEIPAQVTTYHIPYAGKKSPLQCLRVPVTAHVRVLLTSHFLMIEIDNAPSIESVEACIDGIRQQVDEMTAAAWAFNHALEEHIRAFVSAHKRLLRGEQQRLTAWQVDIRERIVGAERSCETASPDALPT